MTENQGKLEKSQGKVREFCVKNLADTLSHVTCNDFFRDGVFVREAKMISLLGCHLSQEI